MKQARSLTVLNASLLYLCVAPIATATAGATQHSAGEEVAVDLESTTSGWMRSSLVRGGDGASPRIRFERFGNQGERGEPQQVLLHEIADASSLRGGIDTRVAPDGDLVVAASFAEGGDDVLYVWRIRQASDRAAPQIVQRGAFVDVPLATSGEGDAQPLRLCHFGEPQVLISEQGLSVLVAANTARGLFVTTAPRSVVQLELADDLSAVRHHRSITQGSSPRVHVANGQWTLAVRDAGPLYMSGHAAPVRFMSSSDARAWTEMELPAQPPLARPDYAIGVSGTQPWLATSTDDARTEVALWRCSTDLPAWWVAGRTQLTEGSKRLRGQSIWLPEPVADDAQAPVLVLEGARGLELTRW